MPKYLHVITHFAPDFHYGGVVESGVKLYANLTALAEFTISTVSANPAKSIDFIGARGRCYRSVLFHKYGFSFSAITGLWRDVKTADVIYTNGIVTFPTTLAQVYAVILKKPFAVATHGLTAWSYSYKKIRKFLYFNLVSFPLMKRAAFIRVTSPAEKEFLENHGFKNIVMVTNGITTYDYNALPVKSQETSGRFVFLFLGRMGKEKGLDILVKAYQQFSMEFSKDKHILKLVGPDLQGYLAHMRLDYAAENIEYIPGVYGSGKIAALRIADVVILPSYSENFGNVVAEAFACETPVITTTGTPWAEIEDVGCGLYVKPEAEALYQAMKAMYLKPLTERREMGRHGREYVLKNFNWEDKARQLLSYLQAFAPGNDKTRNPEI